MAYYISNYINIQVDRFFSCKKSFLSIFLVAKKEFLWLYYVSTINVYTD